MLTWPGSQRAHPLPPKTQQSVQRSSCHLVMDQPRISDGVAMVPLSAECAVPVLSALPADGALDFGQTYLGFSYRSTFTLVNESRLPAKYEVLAQVSGGGTGLHPEAVPGLCNVCMLAVSPASREVQPTHCGRIAS